MSSPAKRPPGADLAIVHLTFEGIQTYGGGVATVTRGHLHALPRVQRALAAEGIAVTPYFGEIAYRKDHPRRDIPFEREAVRLVREMGGDIGYLVNETPGLVPVAPWGVADLGTFENWEIASAAGAAVALNWARRHAEALIYCHDIVFAQAGLYATLQADAFASNAVALYVVHSTALTHELPLPNPERLMCESAAIHWSKVVPTSRIGYISQFIAEHLRRDYGANPKSLVPAGNGINPQDEHFRQRDGLSIAEKLRANDIPVDRPLVFSWGRPVSYKRYDIALRAIAQLQGAVHPVVMLSEESQPLRELANQLGIEVTMLAAFDPELVASMLQWPNTVAALSLAYNEPFGLTPVEVRALARERGALMIVSDTGGLVEQVRDGVDGFVSKQDDPADVARTIRTVLALTPAQATAIRRAGLDRVLSAYTWSSQILTTLAAIYPQWRAPLHRAHDLLAHEDASALVLDQKSA